jgi:hypothetical protein
MGVMADSMDSAHGDHKDLIAAPSAVVAARTTSNPVMMFSIRSESSRQSESSWQSTCSWQLNYPARGDLMNEAAVLKVGPVSGGHLVHIRCRTTQRASRPA